MLRSIIVLIIGLTVTGCVLFGAVHTETKPLTPADLSVTHLYKTPKKNQFPAYFKNFKDPQLNQLITVALAEAPDIQSAKARMERAQQVAQGAFSTLWPSVALSGHLEKAYFPIHGTIPPQIAALTNVSQVRIADIGAQFHYELDFWGKNRENIASKLNEAFAAKMDLAQTQLLLSSAVALAYFDVQNDIVQQGLAKEKANLLNELASIISDRAKQGIESNISLETALTNAKAAQLAVEEYQRAQMQARHQLALLMGKNPFTTQINTSKFSYNKNQIALPAIIPANILARRPDIAAACAMAEAAAHQVNVAKAAFFPNINLKGLVSLESLYFSKAFNIWFQNDNVGAAVELPIFDAGARRANLQVHYAQYDIAVNQYNQTLLNSLKEVSDQLSILETLNRQIAAQSKALKSAESNYNLYKSQYAHGIIEYTQLILIKQIVLYQRAILVNLQTGQIQAYIALLVALGGAF